MPSWNLEPLRGPVGGRVNGGAKVSPGGDAGGSANGFSSAITGRAGLDRTIGTPLSGRMGAPSCNRVPGPPKGSKACEPR